MKRRIVVASYMVRYPLGGMLSWVLQYLTGFHRLGHEVWFVEKADRPGDCWDPVRKEMTDDCRVGTQVVDDLLRERGMGGRWCFVDIFGAYHGLSRKAMESVFAQADVFIDMGSHGSWIEEAQASAMRVFLDGEPGYNHIRFQGRLDTGEGIPTYDAYYTNGFNVGTERSPAPTLGKPWGHVPHPVVVDDFTSVGGPPDGAAFTTVMNWQSHARLTFKGVTYGQKDVEFERFLELPDRVDVPVEVAVGGPEVPWERLQQHGWRTRNGHVVTESVSSFNHYIAESLGEFAVCKNIFVALNTGWFSDRSAAYLASGRPVVMQDTGFSSHLPTGRGLFAVNDVDEAAAAIRAVARDYAVHSAAARDVAREHLDASRVLSRFLGELGL